MVGDFNIHVNDLHDSNTKRFHDILDTFGLIQHVKVQTHKSGNTLDLIISTNNSNLQFNEPVAGYYISDHAIISTNINIVKSLITRKTHSYRNYKGIIESNFSSELTKICEEIQQDKENRMHAYNGKLYNLMDKHAPVITRRISIRKFTPWFDATARTIKANRRKCERLWRQTHSQKDYENFIASKLQFRQYISSKKSQHINDKIKECGRDTRKLYREISSLLDLNKENQFPEKSDDQLAEGFSNFFMEKIEKIREELATHRRFTPQDQSITQFTFFNPIGEEIISKLVKNAKPTTCPLDPLPTAYIHKYNHIIVPVITDIINSSLTTGSVYKEWKSSIIKPLLKKEGLDTIWQNYRPISNLSFISKIAEKACLEQFIPYINNNNLLPSYQSAYRKYYSTETTMIKITNDILWAMEEQKIRSFISMDLSAAFDTVDHQILLEVLSKQYGVTDVALNWFTSYLTNRTCRVRINNTESSTKDVSCSVPQGSIAGPVLFSIYASTLESAITDPAITIMGYADDHCISKSFLPSDESSTIITLQTELSNIKAWMNHNRLKMNEEKSEFIYFGSHQQLEKCTVNALQQDNTIIKRSHSVKYLGVILDENLSFHQHITSKCNIAAINIQRISSIRNYLTIESAKQLAHSFVLPHLDYCNAILYGLPARHIKKLQRIQNWIAKVVLRRNRHESSLTALYDLHWLPISFRIQFKILTMVFKCIIGTAPEYLISLIKLKSFNRETRLSNKPGKILDIPRTSKTIFADRSFQVSGPKLWNDLPTEIQLSTNIEIFKKSLKTYLFQQAFCHLD